MISQHFAKDICYGKLNKNNIQKRKTFYESIENQSKAIKISI